MSDCDCCNENRIVRLESDMDKMKDDLNGVGGKINTLDKEVKALDHRTETLSGEMKLLTQKVDTHSTSSKERHAELKNDTAYLKGEMSEFRRDLADHMVDEPEQVRALIDRAIEPISQGLDKLRSRWTSVSMAAIGLLGSAVIGLVVFIFLNSVGLG